MIRSLSLALMVGLFAPLSHASQALSPYLLMLDASPSMKREISYKKTRFQAMQDAFSSEILRLPPERPVGVATFGLERGCTENIQIVQSPVPGLEAREEAKAALAQMKLEGSGTPFVLGMQSAVHMLTGELVPIKKPVPSPKRLNPVPSGDRSFSDDEDVPTAIFISDTVDTCQADACQFIKDVDARKIKVRIHIIGVGTKAQYNALEIMKCMGQFHFVTTNTVADLPELNRVMGEIVDKKIDALRATSLKLTPSANTPTVIKTEVQGLLLTKPQAAEPTPAPQKKQEEGLRAVELPPLQVPAK